MQEEEEEEEEEEEDRKTEDSRIKGIRALHLEVREYKISFEERKQRKRKWSRRRKKIAKPRIT